MKERCEATDVGTEVARAGANRVEGVAVFDQNGESDLLHQFGPRFVYTTHLQGEAWGKRGEG